MSTDLCPTPNDCKWCKRENWEGDPDLPNGCHYWIEYVCDTCGAETVNRPSNFKEEEPDDLY